MFLILIRHATAKNRSITGKDFDRPLTKEGIKQARKLGEFISSKELILDKVCVSSSLRTRETAEYALQTVSDCIIDEELYLAPEKYLLEFINKLNSVGNIVILGHNDGISSLASYLTSQEISLQTASAVILEFDCCNSNEISADTGKVIDFFSPSQF